MVRNRFLRKMRYFFKRNAYSVAVCVCALVALTMIGVAVSNYASQDNVPVIEDSQTQVPETPVVGDDIILFSFPIKDGVISKEYAEDHLLEDKTTGFWQAHMAIDFSATEGTKVLAVFDGEVEKIENSMMDGLVITIKHSDNLKSVYKCLGDEALVSIGDKVTTGQEIGTVSSNLTEKADGTHLHFELYENDKLIDPTPYFSGSGK